MNNRPALHASRIFSWPAEPSHHKQDTRQVPGPNVRVSPLATPTGAYTDRNMRRAADRAAILEAIRTRKSFCMHDLHKDTGARLHDHRPPDAPAHGRHSPAHRSRQQHRYADHV